MQWLGLRIRPSMTREKHKSKGIGNPEFKGTKEYTKRMRSDSRKNTPTNLETAAQTITNEELQRQLDVKMEESQLLKTVA